MSGFQRQIMRISIYPPSCVRRAINHVYRGLNLVKLKPLVGGGVCVESGHTHQQGARQNQNTDPPRNRLTTETRTDVGFHYRAENPVNDLTAYHCWQWRGITGRTVSFSLCVEALLDLGPANFIPKLINIYQQQAQHAVAEPVFLKRGDAELVR